MAVIDGACPDCGRRIVGMMPQRCFFCGHDFTAEIRAQDPSFKPDPDYKVPGDGLPSEDDVYKALKIQDRYGSLADAINASMDDQKSIGERLQLKVDAVTAECFAFVSRVKSSKDRKDFIAATTGMLSDAFKDERPRIDKVELEEWWDPFKSTQMAKLIAHLTFPVELIIIESEQEGPKIPSEVSIEPSIDSTCEEITDDN